uniref:Profilin n=1 Tax=Trichuris muris TaxID=70415 RepID=A0A5S6R055_TRIMR
MSWADFVQSNLIGTGCVSKAAICSLDGQIWAISDNFQLSSQEAATAANAFKNKDGVQANGLKFEGKKYFVLQVDDERIIGKRESTGFFVYKTLSTVIISVYQDGIQPEQCSKHTGALADYFRQTGY